MANLMEWIIIYWIRFSSNIWRGFESVNHSIAFHNNICSEAKLPRWNLDFVKVCFLDLILGTQVWFWFGFFLGGTEIHFWLQGRREQVCTMLKETSSEHLCKGDHLQNRAASSALHQKIPLFLYKNLQS